MFPITYDEAASSDITDAAFWYDDQSTGLGEEFLTEVDKTLLSIRNNPLLYQEISVNIHQAIIHRFPYSLFYYILKDQIRIIACLHHSRARERILSERT
jgi:plasmid stabilization system protein ParE